MARAIDVAFVGSGGMARRHSEALVKMRGVNIVAFCDPVEERARALAEQYGAQVFKDPVKMMDAVEPSVVYLCLPPFAHGRPEMAAIERGIPFFIEKPITKSLAQARKIAEAVRKAKLITSVGYMNRYRKSVNRAREMLQEDPAVYIQGGWISGTPRPRPEVPITMWWVQKKLSGGQFIEQVTHTVDLVRYLCGEVQEVSAFSATGFNTGVPSYDIEDAMAVSLKLKSGAVANLHACCASNARGGITLNIFAKNCAFEFSGWNHDVKIFEVGRKKPREIAGGADIFTLENRALIKALRTGDTSDIRSTYEDAVNTLEVTVAADRAARTGRVVRLGG